MRHAVWALALTILAGCRGSSGSDMASCPAYFSSCNDPNCQSDMTLGCRMPGGLCYLGHTYGCGSDHILHCEDPGCPAPDLGPPCLENAETACERQCGGGPTQNICFPDPGCSAGTWECSCMACITEDDAGVTDLSTFDAGSCGDGGDSSCRRDEG